MGVFGDSVGGGEEGMCNYDAFCIIIRFDL